MSVGIRRAMAAKKIRLDEEAISEILDEADSESDSSAEASDVDESDESEEEQQQASAQEEEPQAGTSGAGLSNWGPPQGRNITVHPFVGPAKGVKRSAASHINKDSLLLSVLMLFFAQIFHLLVEQTNLYYQQHVDKQAGPSHRLPDITMSDMMTFIALALQMGHDLKDTLQTTGLDLDRYTPPFKVRPRHETGFYTYSVFCTLQKMNRDPTKVRNMTDCGK
jgi:hypothetical protein